LDRLEPAAPRGFMMEALLELDASLYFEIASRRHGQLRKYISCGNHGTKSIGSKKARLMGLYAWNR